jgi:hypothetical protein
MHRSVRLVFLIGLVFPTASLAQWQLDGSGYSTTISTQSKAAIIPDGAGGAIIAWNDFRNGVWDIYAQRINASGVRQWAADGVAVCNAAGDQLVPVIVSDGAGGAIVAWRDYRSGFYWAVYAQRVNASGTAQWTANGVEIGAVNNQYDLSIVSDGASGAILTWDVDDFTPFHDIYAQRINGAGVKQWGSSSLPLCVNGNDQNSPRVVTDGAGGAVFAWRDFRSGTSWDVFGQRVNAAGTIQWGPNGFGVSTDASNQSAPALVSDGAGGAIVTWFDNRSGNDDIYAMRVNTAVLAWTPFTGVPICNATNNQDSPEITSDGNGGAIIAWYDFRNGTNWDVYTQRITFAGAPQWTTNGVALSTAANDQTLPIVVSDGAGGAIVTWKDNQAVSFDLYAQRITAAGAAQWPTNGMPISKAAGNQTAPAAAADGSGGAVIAWEDDRAGTVDIYAQRIEGRYGYWGRPEPTLNFVKDVPADQGGKVRLEWTASGRDALNQQTISSYSIWRAIDQLAFASAIQSGVPAVTLADMRPGFSGKAIRKESGALTDYYWELIGTQDAIYRGGYSFNAATSFDSTVANPATHRFQIVSHASGSQYINWPSNILAGRSVDNLAPPAPLFLTAQRVGNYVYLKWQGVHVPDLDKYTVYRATSTGVTPTPVNFLANDNDTLLTDASAPASALYYIVTATDIHQNQGLKSNEAAVAAATGVGNTPAITALTVLQNHPNPFTGETELNVGLPAKSDVRVDVYDVAGRRVRSVLVPAQEKGWDTLRISARDERGAALPSGVYFVRVHAGGETVTKKMVIAR